MIYNEATKEFRPLSRNNLTGIKPINTTILAHFLTLPKSIPFDNVDVKELCEKVRKCGYPKLSKTLRLEV